MTKRRNRGGVRTGARFLTRITSAAATALLIFCGCTANVRPIKPTEEESAVVGRIGKQEILYDEYRFIVLNCVDDMKEKYGKDFYVFGEFWNGDEKTNNDYLETTGHRFDLIDVRLHQNLFEASKEKAYYDLRQIFNHTLVKNQPNSAVTFVDNHDTQRGQALESTIEEWFKPAAYALILLRQTGLPCIFYGDYYGISGEFAQQDFQDDIDKLLFLRQAAVYGKEMNYFDNPNCIGWSYLGDEEHPTSLAVLINNAHSTAKRMFVGKKWAGKTFTDYLGNQTATITIDEEGYGSFAVGAESVSAYIPQDQ